MPLVLWAHLRGGNLPAQHLPRRLLTSAVFPSQCVPAEHRGTSGLLYGARGVLERTQPLDKVHLSIPPTPPKDKAL